MFRIYKTDIHAHILPILIHHTTLSIGTQKLKKTVPVQNTGNEMNILKSGFKY